MRGLGFISIMLVLLAAPGCSTASLPVIPSSLPEQGDKAGSAQAPADVALIVAGAPTDVYALVARGALKCWFGADGPLRPTHVFHAEAESPTKGGAAEMVLHDRDESVRDKRGARAFRVSFSSAPAGARVAVSVPRMEEQLARLMARDVFAWARGGTDCEVRKQMPAQLTPVAGKDTAGNRR